MTLMHFFAVVWLGFKLSFAFVSSRSSASTGNPQIFHYSLSVLHTKLPFC